MLGFDIHQFIRNQKAVTLSKNPSLWFQKNFQELPNLNLGCTFTPEKTDQMGVYDPMIILRFIVEVLGIKRVRIGFRWSTVEKAQGKLDIGFYKPFLDYLFSQKVKVTLNTGPIKVNAWPEAHVPEWAIESIKSDPKAVAVDSELGILARDYLDRLLSLLKKTYKKSELDNIVAFNPENESFNSWGGKFYHSTPNYLVEIIKKHLEYFPNASILLNSSGFEFREIYETIILSQKLDTHFIIGYDYYYTNDKFKNFGWIQRIDPLSFSPFKTFSPARIQVLLKYQNISYEITELQMESWGREREPVENPEKFLFALQRGLDWFPKNQESKVINLWGVEQLSGDILSRRGKFGQLIIADIIKFISRV